MVKCPSCGAEAEKPSKTWRYGVFTVDAYTCEGCGLRFKEYPGDSYLGVIGSAGAYYT